MAKRKKRMAASTAQGWLELKKAAWSNSPVRVEVSAANGSQLVVRAGGVQGTIQMGGTGKTPAQLKRMVGTRMIAIPTNVDPARRLLELTVRGADLFHLPLDGALGPVPVERRSPGGPRVGDVLRVEVIAIKEAGLHVLGPAGRKVGGERVRGVVAKTELDWTSVADPASFTKKGDHFDAKILEYDRHSGWYRFSFRQAVPDPLRVLAERHEDNHRYLSRIIRVSESSVELRIEPPLDLTVTLPSPLPGMVRELIGELKPAFRPHTKIWTRIRQLDPSSRVVRVQLHDINSGGAIPAHPSWGLPMELHATLRWALHGITAEHAGAWVVRGFTAKTASDWIDAGVADADGATDWDLANFPPAEAAPWVALEFRPSEASAWVTAGFTALDAGAWKQGFPNKKERRRWESAGRPASEAERWRAAGSSDLRDTVQRRRAGQQDPLDTPARSERATGAPAEDDLGAPATEPLPVLRRPDPAKRSRSPIDGLFGSPRTTEDLTRWAARVPEGPSAWTPRPATRANGSPWPGRLAATDVLKLRLELDSRSTEPKWPTAIRSLNRAALHVLADAGESWAAVEADPPPSNLLPEVVLPFPAVAVWFAARFRLRDEQRRHLPGWQPHSEQSQLPFEPWLATLEQRGGNLAGVILQSGSVGSGVADECIWLIEVTNQVIPVPSHLTRSALGPVATNLAAALCFGSWVRTVSGRRTPYGSAVARPRTPRPPSAVHVVRYRNQPPKPPGPGGARLGGPRGGHLRRGHWRRSQVGPRHDWHYEWRWIAPTFVGGSFIDAPDIVYHLPRLIFARRHG